MGARHILTEGCFWRVEDGHSIHIWGDQWLLDAEHKKIVTPLPENQDVHFVCDLIHQDRKAWNRGMLNDFFSQLIYIPLLPFLYPRERSQTRKSGPIVRTVNTV